MIAAISAPHCSSRDYTHARDAVRVLADDVERAPGGGLAVVVCHAIVASLDSSVTVPRRDDPPFLFGLGVATD